MKETLNYKLPIIELDDYYDIEVWNTANNIVDTELKTLNDGLDTNITTINERIDTEVGTINEKIDTNMTNLEKQILISKCDFDGDGVITSKDLEHITKHYNSTDPEVLKVYDLNNDGIIDIHEYTIMETFMNEKAIFRFPNTVTLATKDEVAEIKEQLVGTESTIDALITKTT